MSEHEEDEESPVFGIDFTLCEGCGVTIPMDQPYVSTDEGDFCPRCEVAMVTWANEEGI